MEKRRLFKIMSKADRNAIIKMADKVRKNHELVVIKEPEKALAMIKMREPIKESLFYLGEVIVTEATVSVDGVGGMAVAWETILRKPWPWLWWMLPAIKAVLRMKMYS